MEVHEKRKLLEAVDVLIKRPMAANEQTLGEAIGYMALLVEELTQNQLTLVCVERK